MGKVCSIDGCIRPAVARTWCRAHWKHWRRWGDPTYFQTEKPRKPARDRFWPKVKVAGADDCWEWKACRDGLGYGMFRVVPGETMKRSHRVSWEMANGPIPDGMVVCHRCDNPPCVNPAHLFLGTDQDNVDDRVAKGRSSRLITHFGEASPLAKLTTQQVTEIRARYAAKEANQRELGEEYGVAQSTISKIVLGYRRKAA